MPIGCMNPGAVNYNPSADTEDYSCMYLVKHNGVCHLFKDIIPTNLVDNSFTLSYSLLNGGWVFFHDYIPDFYYHTREQLFSLKDNNLRKHHAADPGKYDSSTPSSFFIDVVFRAQSDMILDAVNWINDFLNKQGTDAGFTTLTHIAIWNSNQHTGRIPVTQIENYTEIINARKLTGIWGLDGFRDILSNTDAGDFLMDIFHNYALNSDSVDPDKSWYDKRELQDKWFCVRFEFDNSSVGNFVLHDVGAYANPTSR